MSMDLTHVPVRIVSPQPGPELPVHRSKARRPQSAVPSASSGQARGQSAVRSPLPTRSVRWARKYDRCQDPACTTPDSPHAGLGLCRTSYYQLVVRGAGAVEIAPGPAAGKDTR
jgi:hypothetical protein